MAGAVAFLASRESGMMTGSLVEFDQPVAWLGANAPPPPVAEWPRIAAVTFT